MANKSKGNIYKYDLNGEFICEYESIESAAYLDKLSSGYLLKHIEGKFSFCKNHIYSKKFYIKLPSELLEHKSKRIYKTKQVHQYSLDGKYVKSYGSCQDAAIETGFKCRYIMNFASGNLNKRSKTYKGFMWSYEKKNELPKFEKDLPFKEIHQYSLDGIYIRSFNSLKEAALYVGGNYNTISHSARGTKGTPTAKGFIWSLKKVKKVKPSIPKKKTINVYKNDKLYKTFESIVETSKQLNLNRSNITNCLNGRNKSFKGFIFKYKNIS
jgi:hypothetical protein